MKYAGSLNLECPHCVSNCQFIEDGKNHICSVDKAYHFSYFCTSCGGKIMARFYAGYNNPDDLIDYSPVAFTWKQKTKLSLISDENVRKDFKEAIQCYNNGFYNATMVMARRAIHREMIKRGLEAKYPNNLYEQIENSGISENLKRLLQKVKNFGNNGAHPDFCLYDEKGILLEDEKKFAELSLNFLDKYFSDEYEIESMIKSAPRSQKEIEEEAAATGK